MILVTGASGFVGKPLCEALTQAGYSIRTVTRDMTLADSNKVVYIESIGSQTDWTEALKGVDTVIHLAARAHVIREREEHPLIVFKEINTFGTFKLAEQSVAGGVKRFIFLSSIAVNGEVTQEPFNIDSKPSPVSPYGISKFEAENGLQDICKDSKMDLVILRPPLIYGPAAKGNIERLILLIQKGLPLPFGCIENKRTILYVKNLIDLILNIVSKKEKINDTFLVADCESISTKELTQNFASILNPNLLLIPVPIPVLKLLGLLFGKSDEIKRLTGNLEIDISFLHEKLGWTPPYSTHQGLIETAKWYQECTK